MWPSPWCVSCISTRMLAMCWRRSGERARASTARISTRRSWRRCACVPSLVMCFVARSAHWRCPRGADPCAWSAARWCALCSPRRTGTRRFSGRLRCSTPSASCESPRWERRLFVGPRVTHPYPFLWDALATEHNLERVGSCLGPLLEDLNWSLSPTPRFGLGHPRGVTNVDALRLQWSSAPAT